MNKLIAISVALLSLNLYGADKTVISDKGLEGWDNKGIAIIVSDKNIHPITKIDDFSLSMRVIRFTGWKL